MLVRGLAKSFNGGAGLTGIDFDLREREIHAVLGVDGAGKSTFCRILAGHLAFGDGEITYRGYPIRLRSIRDALRIGIALVGQPPSLAPDLTVLENIFLPTLGRKGRLDQTALRKLGLDLLSSFGRADLLPLDREVGRLTASERQIVEICKALAVRAKLLIFDEPTATLEARESGQLFDLMARLRLGGRGVVFASSRAEECLAVADRISVLRDGRLVLEGVPACDLTVGDASDAMRLTRVHSRGAAGRLASTTISDSGPVLEVHDLVAPPAVRAATFSLRAGEIVGLAGIVGAGRSEVLESIFGLRARAGGRVIVNGRALRPGRPGAAVEAGLRFGAEDRLLRNVWPDLSVADNLRLVGPGRAAGVPDDEWVLITLGLDDADAMSVPMRSAPANLQQKVVIARCLRGAPRAVLLDEPTRGVDEDTRSTIHACLRAAAARGTALLLVCSDPDELLDLCDRVVVMRDGRTVADLSSHRIDPAALTLLCAPQAALARNTALLTDLTGENGGVGFWVRIDSGQVVCLNAVVAEPAADPGFTAGEALDIPATRIPAALRQPSGEFVKEEGDERYTMLVPIKGPRSTDLGFIGLSLTDRRSLPPPAAVKFRVDTLAARL